MSGVLDMNSKGTNRPPSNESFGTENDELPDWWDRIGQMRWQHVVVCFAAAAGFAALCFSPAGSCSVSIHSQPLPPTTTTVAP
jgi:hypothetical protein